MFGGESLINLVFSFYMVMLIRERCEIKGWVLKKVVVF